VLVLVLALNPIVETLLFHLPTFPALPLLTLRLFKHPADVADDDTIAGTVTYGAFDGVP